eukprot:6174927-Pleurochrysis_carterae.AAC.3
MPLVCLPAVVSVPVSTTWYNGLFRLPRPIDFSHRFSFASGRITCFAPIGYCNPPLPLNAFRSQAFSRAVPELRSFGVRSEKAEDEFADIDRCA